MTYLPLTIGRILNFFSKDVAAIDQGVMIIFGWLVFIWASLFSFMIAIITATRGTVLVILAPMAYLYHVILGWIRMSLTEIQRMEAITKSPVYSSFSETVAGVTTIRAYAQQRRFIAQNEHLVDTNNCAAIPQVFTMVWLAQRLGLMGACVTCASCAAAVALKGTINAGTAGIAIMYSLNLPGICQHVVNLSAYFEVQLVSVERAQTCSETLEHEVAGAIVRGGKGEGAAEAGPVKAAQLESAVAGAGAAVAAAAAPGPSWPSEGRIEFQEVAIAYRDGPLVLKGISFKMGKHEKVGVVGRTGSGKSTVFLALFRALLPRAGRVLIDGVDIGSVPLAGLRSMLGIIPQDPMLFADTVRFNIDPLALYSDAQVWAALSCVDLKAHVERLPGGLAHPVTEGGSNFSAGQRQLLCIARAVLRQPRVLVMDEATASIDVETDNLIQKMIRDSFQDCSVLTIAHRLHTVMDSDRILVLDQGEVSEFAAPAVLLADEASALSAMVDATGEEHARSLRAVATATAERKLGGEGAGAADA